MNRKVFLNFANKIVEFFWETREVKELVVRLLEKYVHSTDNDIDDLVANIVRTKLLK